MVSHATYGIVFSMLGLISLPSHMCSRVVSRGCRRWMTFAWRLTAFNVTSRAGSDNQTTRYDARERTRGHPFFNCNLKSVGSELRAFATVVRMDHVRYDAPSFHQRGSKVMARMQGWHRNEEEDEYRRKLLLRARKGDLKAQAELMEKFGMRVYSDTERSNMPTYYDSGKKGSPPSFISISTRKPIQANSPASQGKRKTTAQPKKHTKTRAKPKRQS
jgi:hypothetical protein